MVTGYNYDITDPLKKNTIAKHNLTPTTGHAI